MNTYINSNDTDINNLKYIAEYYYNEYIKNNNIPINNFILDIIITTFKNNKSIVYQISPYNNFEIKKSIINNINDVGIYIAGIKTQEAYNLTYKNLMNKLDIKNIYQNVFNNISYEGIGGKLLIYKLDRKNNIKLIYKNNIKELDNLRYYNFNMHNQYYQQYNVVGSKVYGEILAGINLEINCSDTQGNKTFIINQDKVEISGLALQIIDGGIQQSQLSPATQSLITNAVQIDTLAPDLLTPTLTNNINGTIYISINKPTTSGSNTKPDADDLAGFNIWRKTSNNPTTATLINSLTTTNTTCPSILSITDSNVDVGTPYYYWVSAYDTQGNESDKIQAKTIDNQISIIPSDILPPSAPSNLIIRGGWGRIDLSWDAPTDKDILKYKIRISDNSNFSSYTDVYTFTTKYTDFDRTTIDTRYYRVYTIDKAGNKSWNEITVPSSGYIESNGKAITPGDNEAPHSVTSGTLTSDSNGNFILTFIGSDSPDASLYRIVRHTCTDFIASNDDGGIDVGIINHLGVGQHKFIDKDLEKYKYYYYKIYTIDNSGMISAPLVLLSITQDGITYPFATSAIDITAPLSPEYLQLEAKIGGITVYWDSVPEAVSYNVFRYDSDGNNELFMGNTTQLQFTDNSMLTNFAQIYQYKISAIDSWDNESFKSDTSGNIQSLTPFTANDTTAPFIGIFNDPVANNDGSIILSWSGFSDLESGVGGYNIWRILSTQTFNDKILLKSINNKNITSYIDINTIHNTTYKYTITCFDGAGNESEIETNLSNWKQVTAFDTTAPDEPSDLVVLGGLGSIVLTWTAPNNTDINKYKIEKSNYADFNTLTSDSPVYTILTTYTDSNIMSLNTRYYRIYTIDNAGLISSTYLSGDGICAIPGDGVAPTSLPTIDNVNSKSNYDGSISIVWTHTNPDGDLAKYRVYRSESNIQNPDPIPIYVNIGEVQKDTKIYHDTGLKNGIYYKYKLSSVDYSGMEYSGTEVITSNITNWLLATDDSAPIITNVNLIAEEDLGAIKLKWMEVSEKGVTYEIYRCNGEDAEWDGLNNLPIKIATVAGSTSGNGQQGMYTDYDPPVGTATTYTYALKVVDAWGNISGFTNHATATSINNFTGTLNGIGESTLTNGIKIDSENGLVITKTDNKVRTKLSATEGFKIQSGDGTGLENSWENKLFADENGNLTLKGNIEIGSGSSMFKADTNGIYLGSNDHLTAPFSVDLSGNAKVSGIINCTDLKINGTSILDITENKITSAGLNSTVNNDIEKGKTARSYFDLNGNLIMDHVASITWGKIDTTGATAGDVNARPDTWMPTASDVGAVANNQTAVFNALTNNGVLPGLFMSGGQLYINASYINAGILQGLTVRTGAIGSTRVELKSDWADIDVYNGSNNIFRIEDQLLSVVIYNPLGYGMTIGKVGKGDIVCNGTWDFTDATVNGVVAKLG